jgi:hypothetical protein
MADISKALSAKAEKILDKQMNYRRFGILTRREFCQKMLEIGAIPKIEELTETKRNPKKFSYSLSWQEISTYQDFIEKTVTGYHLYYPDEDGTCAVVTKTEYDYFMALLSEEQDRKELAEFNSLSECDRNAIESLFVSGGTLR